MVRPNHLNHPLDAPESEPEESCVITERSCVVPSDGRYDSPNSATEEYSTLSCPASPPDATTSPHQSPEMSRWPSTEDEFNDYVADLMGSAFSGVTVIPVTVMIMMMKMIMTLLSLHKI